MTIAAGSPAALWSANARAVLHAVLEAGPVARPDIRRATGLSKTAVSQTLAELQRRGLVVDAGVDHERRGPVATLWAIRNEHATGAAVDLGHRTIRVRIVGIAGGVLAHAEADADHSSVSATAAAVAALVASCAPQVPLSRAVVGVAAVVHGDELRLGSGLADDGRGLPAALRDALPMPVHLENDTNLAAIAEQRASGLRDFALLSVGSSMGAGIVVDGRPHRGIRGGAGEVNYLPGPGDTVDDTSGSASVLADARAEGLSAASAKAVFEAARAGDPAALRAVDRTAARLARVAAALSLVLDPEAVVLGGSIGGNGDLLLQPLRDRLRERFPQADVPVLAAQAGDDAVLDGASALLADRLREVGFDVSPAG